LRYPHHRDRASLLSLPTRRSSDLEFDYRMIGADGRTVWFRDNVFADLEEGRPVRLRGLLIDISAQKHMESQIRQQGETLRLLAKDRKSTRLNSSHQIISYAVFCLK